MKQKLSPNRLILSGPKAGKGKELESIKKRMSPWSDIFLMKIQREHHDPMWSEAAELVLAERYKGK